MNYITSRKASEIWGITVRQVQTLCGKGKVEGAIRFNRSWAIPEGAPKPEDYRFRNRTSRIRYDEDSRGMDSSNFLLPFKTILDDFPYKITVSMFDGTMLYANAKFMEGALDEARNSAIGNYNIMHEPKLDKWGLKEHVAKAFRGEFVYTPDLEYPSKELVDVKLKKGNVFTNIYHDITSFPIVGNNGGLAYVVTVFVPTRKYSGREEVSIGKEYIELHWREPFNVKLVAKAANLSPSRFTALFRKYAGFTPHKYYINVKMEHIKEMLLNESLSVSQAFNECGIDYNSYYVSLFRKYAGYTPMQLRNRRY